MIAVEHVTNQIMQADSFLSSLQKPSWFRREIFQFGDVKLTKKYINDDSKKLWRKFTEITGNIKNVILPIYQRIFNGPLPSGRQMEERLEELRTLLHAVEVNNKKKRSKAKQDKRKEGQQNNEGEEKQDEDDEDDEEDEEQEGENNNPVTSTNTTSSAGASEAPPPVPKDYFPMCLLAFFAYGPLSSQPYAGWADIPKDEGMGKIPESSGIQPLSRSGLQKAKEDAVKAIEENEGSSSSSKKRKGDTSGVVEVGDGLVKELKRQNEI
jgi:hypothetical protein